MGVINRARKHDGGPRLALNGARKHARHHIARLKRSHAPSSSSKRAAECAAMRRHSASSSSGVSSRSRSGNICFSRDNSADGTSCKAAKMDSAVGFSMTMDMGGSLGRGVAPMDAARPEIVLPPRAIGSGSGQRAPAFRRSLPPKTTPNGAASPSLRLRRPRFASLLRRNTLSRKLGKKREGTRCEVARCLAKRRKGAR